MRIPEHTRQAALDRVQEKFPYCQRADLERLMNAYLRMQEQARRI